MSGDAGKMVDFNKEYLHVRRLISVLTNDNSDKMIVEKLKGKNLSSLLFNAKIIDSKNMAANKRILGCVIRAIEWEKHVCRQRELEQSWARKLLASFNCLVPVKSAENVRYAKSACAHRNKKSSTTNNKYLDLRKRIQFRSSKSINKSKGSKVFSRGPITEVKMMECIKNDPYRGEFIMKNSNCGLKALGCSVKLEMKQYEALIPVNLGLLQQRHFTAIMLFEEEDISTAKKCSSTQTFERKNLDNCNEKPAISVANNIKLQDLLEAASSLINTQDQREYVRTFLSNFEPPFDLSGGFPPYLKLPMNRANDKVGNESIYESNSELSIAASISRHFPNNEEPIAETDDVSKIRQENVKKYVRELAMDPWQGTAESIISGVINESLPHDKADYSQLGACILKRLGALPMNGCRDQRVQMQQHQAFSGSKVQEIVLSSTEWFESDSNGDHDNIMESNVHSNGQNNITKSMETNREENSRSRESIVEIKLLDQDRSRPWESQGINNFCFYDSGTSGQKVDLLDLSEGSIAGIVGQDDCQDIAIKNEQQNDRKSFQPEPLTISPSGITPVERKCLKRDIFCKQKPQTTQGKNTKTLENELRKETTGAKKHLGTCHRNLVEEPKVECAKLEVVSESSQEPEICMKDDQPRIDNGSENDGEFETDEVEDVLLPPAANEAELTENAKTVESVVSGNTHVVEQPAAPKHNLPEQIPWEVTVKDIETYDGVGECHSNLSEQTKTRKSIFSNAKERGNNAGTQKRYGKSRKCKKFTKNDESNRNCKVM